MLCVEAYTAQAQGPRFRLGGPGLRALDRDQEKSVEQGMPIEPSDAQPVEQNTTDNSPAAESYRKGSEALAKGQADAAIGLLSRAIQLDAKYAPAYCDRGLAWAMKGELDKALADLSTAIQLAPTGGRSYFNRGFAYFQKGEYDKALADYSEAIRLHPDYAEAYRDRGYVRTLKGNLEQALADLDFALRLNPKDPSAYASRGKTYCDLGDWESAIADYDQALQLDAKDAATWCDRGNARAMRGDFDAALADVERALKLAPNEPAYRFTRGFAYLKKGDLHKALADFNEVLRVDPKFGEAYRERGHCLIVKGEFDKARGDLDEALKLVPEDYTAFFYRGYASAMKGDFDKALADYDQAIKLEPTYAEAYFNRALAYAAKSDFEKALADYKQVIGLDPRTPEGYKDWGRAEDKEGRVKTVEQLEQTLLQAKPDAQQHFRQGAALHKEGTLDQALAEYDKAVELYPRYPEVYYNRGLAYRHKDDLVKAIADYSRAIRLDPKYVPAYANRGYVYYKLGRLQKALADFDKILELDPGNANARESRNIILSQKTSEAKMSISKQSWGKTPEGAEVDLYTLGNANGLRVKIMTYGATIASVEVPDRNGKTENVTLHLDSLADYLKGHPFFGSTVGRYGNRIAKGRFTLDGKQYTLATNNGPNHLHGGLKGFDKAVWKAEPVQTDDSVGVVFSYQSADGEEGYPGAMSVRVTYSLTNENELKMAYWAKTDKPTVVNLTNHTYWNLENGGASDVLEHQLTLNADRYLPVDAGLIPTGELKSVKGTPMDFLQPNTIGARIKQVDGGYDHCYVLNREQGEKGLSLAARAVAPKSGRVMEIYTTQPAIQFYTGNFLDGTLHAAGKTYGQHFGFCLETQHYPDSPNQPAFPSTVLRPGEQYEQLTVHKFSVQ
jgi:aldose 1-epimerase